MNSLLMITLILLQTILVHNYARSYDLKFKLLFVVIFELILYTVFIKLVKTTILLNDIMLTLKYYENTCPTDDFPFHLYVQ